MTGMCIYKGNRGLGACAGPVSKVKVASKRTAAWKGLNDLAERLKDAGEEPGVCKVHEKHAGENGYLLASDAPAPRKTKTVEVKTVEVKTEAGRRVPARRT